MPMSLQAQALVDSVRLPRDRRRWCGSLRDWHSRLALRNGCLGSDCSCRSRARRGLAGRCRSSPIIQFPLPRLRLLYESALLLVELAQHTSPGLLEHAFALPSPTSIAWPLFPGACGRSGMLKLLEGGAVVLFGIHVWQRSWYSPSDNGSGSKGRRWGSHKGRHCVYIEMLKPQRPKPNLT